MKHTRYRSDYDERSARFVGYRDFLFGSGLRLAFWERSDSVTGGEKSMARSTDAGNDGNKEGCWSGRLLARKRTCRE